jgi:hypothetical protein
VSLVWKGPDRRREYERLELTRAYCPVDKSFGRRHIGGCCAEKRDHNGHEVEHSQGAIHA